MMKHAKALKLQTVVAAIVLTGAPLVAFAYTWRVPSEHPTICGAVDSASYGDTVPIAPGTYCRERDVATDYGWVWIQMHDGITLMSEAGSSVTTLLESGTNLSSIAVFCDGVDNSSVKGFTLMGGSCSLSRFLQSSRTGILMLSCDMVAEGNAFEALMWGVRIAGDSPRIETPEVRGNEIHVCHKGIAVGSISTARSPLIEENMIYDCNFGIWARNCSPYIVGNTITHNDIDGVYFEGSSGSRMESNIITFNMENGVSAFMDDPWSSPCLNCAWLPERANDVFGNGEYDVYYEEDTGLGLLEARYNYWGTLCPDPVRFFGNVSTPVWVDSTHTVVCTDCESCYHSTEPTTWGTIKAMYR